MNNDPHPLNTVCPYYTMFPLTFPAGTLARANASGLVADPYCGRGTTLYAARARGLTSYGIDSSAVAVAIARAKLTATSLSSVMRAYDRLMSSVSDTTIPEGAFWRLAFHARTLSELCRLREALGQISACGESSAVTLLRAIVLGALHGPLNSQGLPGSYFSNQMPRTFAPKPDYAVRFWRERKLRPSASNVREVVRRRAKVICDQTVLPRCEGRVVSGNSQHPSAWRDLPDRIAWVVSSPPYFGMRTYEEDQWLRHWFLGGPSQVKYGNPNQLSHQSPEAFASSMAEVWDNVGDHACEGIRMVIRFGAIGSRRCDYRQIMTDSLSASRHHWRLWSSRAAGEADDGRRQSRAMGARAQSSSIEERDFFVRLA